MEICLFKLKNHHSNLVNVKLNKVEDIIFDGVTIQKCFISLYDSMSYWYCNHSVLPDTKLCMPEIILLKDVPLIFLPSELLTSTNSKYKAKIITNSSTATGLIIDSRYSLPPSLTQGIICKHLVDMLEEYKTIKLVESL